MEPRKLTKDDVEVCLTIEEEDHGPLGSFDTGDEEADLKLCRDINRRLEGGDMWAWCVVKVEVKYGGFSGIEYLGACSYDGERDFRAGGYYDDMVDQAVDDLNSGIARTWREIAPLIA